MHVTIDMAFLKNQYYFRKKYFQEENDLIEEKYSYDWDVEHIMEPINKPNIESTIIGSEVTIINNTTTKGSSNMESYTKDIIIKDLF